MNDLIGRVYHAASQGNLPLLKEYLKNLPKEEIQKVVNSYTENATPLLMACKNGHYAVVKYLLEECEADIEQAGAIFLFPETLQDVTPLWIAVASRQMVVVAFLIYRRANVNRVDSTYKTTPFHAACKRGFWEMFQLLAFSGTNVGMADINGDTSLMVACSSGNDSLVQYFLKKGSDTNKRNKKGKSALHFAASKGDLASLKLLLDHGAESCRSKEGLTPMMEAAIGGHQHLVEHFKTLPNSDRAETIVSLELLGSIHLNEHEDALKAMECWNRAMKMRFQDGLPAMPKEQVQSILAARLEVREAQTWQDLDLIRADPFKMCMQSLLIWERIFGSTYPATIDHVLSRGHKYFVLSRFDLCAKLWFCAMEMHQKDGPLTSEFNKLVSHLCNMFYSKLSMNSSAVLFRDVFQLFQSCFEKMKGMQIGPEATQNEILRFRKMLKVSVRVIGLIQHFFKKQLSLEEEKKSRDAVRQLVLMNPRGENGRTLLHIACTTKLLKTRFDSSPLSHPSAEVILFLIEMGANPNALDFDLNTPLHLAVIQENSPTYACIIAALLEHGAHIDYKNSANVSALDCLRKRTFVNPFAHLTLQCLASRVLKSNLIFFKNRIPFYLEDFVNRH